MGANAREDSGRGVPVTKHQVTEGYGENRRGGKDWGQMSKRGNVRGDGTRLR